jgi:hypothetical protein
MKSLATRVPAATILLFILGLGCLLPGCNGDTGTSPGNTDDPPTVVFVSPTADQELSGAVELEATATRADRVRFFVDNAELGEDTTAPYSFTWNSGLVANGVHTLMVRAEGPGGTAQDEVAVLINNTAGTVTITVTPGQVSLDPGLTQQFTAQVAGLPSDEVVWSVDGGPAHGTISATGLYTAPNIVPNPASATVRATSATASQHSGTAQVTLTGGGGGGGNETEAFLCSLAFGGAQDFVDMGENALEYMVQAVWEASVQNGGAWTFVGTLTQTAPGSDQFTYSPTPNDRLVLQLSGSAAIEFTINAIDGYVDGGWSDFLHSHEVDFGVRITDAVDLAVFSRTLPQKDGAWNWNRTYSGTITGNGDTVQLNLTDTGNESYETGYSFANGTVNQETTGSLTATGISVTVNQAFSSSLIHNSNAATEVRNFLLTTRNSATLDGHTYTYTGAEAGSPAGVRWETFTQFVNGQPDDNAYNVVHEPEYWAREGGLLRDGEVFGLLEFTGPVINGTWGPDLVLRTQDSGDLFLHTLISEP